MTFKLYRVRGARLSPEAFGGREPSYDAVIELRERGRLSVESIDMETVNVGGETLWLTSGTYKKASSVLGAGSDYDGHEGASLSASKGAWVIEEIHETEPPLGTPKDREYVVVSTRLSSELGLGQFVVEKDFVFYGYEGKDIDVCGITRRRPYLLAYDRSGNPLSEAELRGTLLWRNYLSDERVKKELIGASQHLKKTWWHVERMGARTLSKLKVVWRDVAKRFIPAIDSEGHVPDYTVNYIVARDVEEARYLLAVLLSPQVNALVEELSPWIGHVQPRFLRYVSIPRYDPTKRVHKELAEVGKLVCTEGLNQELVDRIEKLVDNLRSRS